MIHILVLHCWNLESKFRFFLEFFSMIIILRPDIAFMENLQSWYIDQKRLHKKYLFQMLVNGIEHYKAKPSLVELTIPDDG